jgi:hypothetical protein
MKTISVILLMLFSFSINSQLYNPYGFDCTLPDNPPQIIQSVIGGQHKPESIERYTTQQDAYFPVLIVYVQFLNDPGPDWEGSYWRRNQAPVYMSSVIASEKRTSSDWWNAYNENSESLSDFWMEASRGKFHIVGKEVNVVLPNEYTYYQQFGSRGIEKINDDIYAILQQDTTIIWPAFDLWSKNGNGVFKYVPDGRVDMIYKVHRSHSPRLGMPAGGIAILYNSYSQGLEYLIYNQGGVQIYINGDFGNLGSGLTMTPGHGWPEEDPNYFRYAPLTKRGVLSFSEHEHGHYIFGAGHQKYGKMMGIFALNGVDEFLSPYESIRLGYMESRKVNYNFTNSYSLGDYSSRSGNSYGEVLEVPINGQNEFFLIANRQRVSTYDIIMWGDTCRGDPYFDLGNKDYGKGVYIYHANPGTTGYPFLIDFDQECADGLWDWVQDGYRTPDWSNEQNVEYFKQSLPVFSYNDNGGDNSLSNHDGKSLIHNWFGIGKRHTCIDWNQECSKGTDRIFTNLQEVWTSREWQGDRWDAWRVGYNQVFSPYSSPSTRNWNHNQTGIFIYLESQSGTTANFKIYKAGEGGMTEDDILAVTPPSKPVLYRDVEITECVSDWANPKIIWDNNLEPDMRRGNLISTYKRYYIYRAEATIDNIPVNYQYIATYDDYTPDDTASFIDNNLFNGVRIYCGNNPSFSNDIHYRYRIVAVDKYNYESVPSDFVYIKGHPIQPDNFIYSNTETPIYFSLAQNYPNPFNPNTIIKYSVPKAVNVKLTVYDILGKEVAVLVNETKQPGFYEAEFNASGLATGVYFYKIEAGKFNSVKKMILVK